MSFALSLLKKNELAISKKVDAFLEYFEDEETRGIAVTEDIAKNIIESTQVYSSEHGRVILDSSLSQRVAAKFSRSDFLNNYNFARTVTLIIEQIFRVQTETEDRFNDNDLIEVFFNFFESRNCAGSIELLQDFASQIISKNNNDESNILSTENLDFTTIDFREKKEEDDAQ